MGLPIEKCNIEAGQNHSIETKSNNLFYFWMGSLLGHYLNWIEFYSCDLQVTTKWTDEASDQIILVSHNFALLIQLYKAVMLLPVFPVSAKKWRNIFAQIFHNRETAFNAGIFCFVLETRWPFLLWTPCKLQKILCLWRDDFFCLKSVQNSQKKIGLRRDFFLRWAFCSG